MKNNLNVSIDKNFNWETIQKELDNISTHKERLDIIDSYL